MKKDNPISGLIADAEPVNTKGKIDRFADQRVDEYAITKYQLGFWKQGRSKEAPDIYTKLGNFCLLIVEEQILDDGLRTEMVFILEGRRFNGQPLHPVTIPTSQFPDITRWLLKHYGTHAILEANQATPRFTATAITKLSGRVPRTTIYQHTGWKRINEKWHYLTGSGALSETGLNKEIRVDLGAGNLNKYELPDPTHNPSELVRHVFGLLEIAPDNKAVGVALFCGIVRAALGECLPTDFSLFFLGATGAQKSECAGLAMAFFGRFNSRNLPASWHDTDSALEVAGHKAKDAVWVIDDFKCGANQQETNKIYSKAERIFRAVGNQSARGRCHTDMGLKESYFPRCMLLSTGEDLPKGASLLGRMLVIELKKGDINLSYLTTFQEMAQKGQLAQIMSAFIHWLAPRIDDLKRSFPTKVRDLRSQALQDKFAISHSRAADIYASLFAAADIFIDFAHDAGAINEIRANDLAENIAHELKAALRQQSTYQAEADECTRFVNLLRSCFISGDVHISDDLKQGPPVQTPHAWGWSEPNHEGDRVSRGSHIGWIKETSSELLLDPDAAFKAVQRFASAQNEAILMQKSTLFRRMLDRGLIICFEEDKKSGRKRPDVKRSVGGKTTRVCIFSTALILGGKDE